MTFTLEGPASNRSKYAINLISSPAKSSFSGVESFESQSSSLLGELLALLISILGAAGIMEQNFSSKQQPKHSFLSTCSWQHPPGLRTWSNKNVYHVMSWIEE